MPKNKKVASDSESDSGPEDRTPVAKKSKSESGGSGSGSGLANPPKKNEEGDEYWEIGNKKRATVRVFKGVVYVDFREYYEKDGKAMPGKKGVMLKAGEWNTVRNLMDDIDEVVKTK